ncbi:hypothetical protein GQ457_07G042490 [Hibiscus cannabinus]
MASLYCNNQERDACFTNASYGRSRSKAQACLEKILHLISTVPPPCENNSGPFKKRGFDIDLNLRLGSFLDDGEESEEKSDCLAESSFIEDKTGTATTTDASSDVTDIQKIEEFKSGTDGEVKTAVAFNDSLDLLIEAAEMLANRDYYMNGKEKEKEKEVEEVEKSGGGGSMPMERDKDSSVNVEGEWEDRAAPVVRSKRGRSQVLPLRYRDSVLEPWMKRPQIQIQRSTAAAVVSKKKRKPR